MTISALDQVATAGYSNQAALSSANSKTVTDAHAAAREYESVFLSTMLNSMMPKSEAAPEFGGGNAEATWRGMLVEEQAKSIAAAGGIGLADDIARQLIAVQEENNQ